MPLIDTEKIIDETVLIKGITPAVEAVRSFLEVLSASPLLAPEGFVVTITVDRKSGA